MPVGVALRGAVEVSVAVGVGVGVSVEVFEGVTVAVAWGVQVRVEVDVGLGREVIVRDAVWVGHGVELLSKGAVGTVVRCLLQADGTKARRTRPKRNSGFFMARCLSPRRFVDGDRYNTAPYPLIAATWP